MGIQLDEELILALIKDINNYAKTLISLFPKGNKEQELKLKHLAAAMIHFGFFTFDIFGNVNQDMRNDYKDFLKECGCNIKIFEDEIDKQEL